MSTVTLPAPTTTTRDARPTRRLIAAILLPVAPLSVAVLRGIWPSFSASDTAGSIQAAAAHPDAQEAVVWLGSLMMLTMVPAMLAAVRLARRRRPVLAMLAAGVNLVAYLGTALTTGDLLTLVAARDGYDRGEMVGFIDAMNAHPTAVISIVLFVVGHIVGMILLGAALWRIIPAWASVALIVSQPLHFVAYVVLQAQALDALAWGLTAAGFAACALKVLRTPDDAWDLAPTQS
ncbi:hypothetical protein [Phytohabitans rumicis]|uniref:DUF4386 domain-containing protein n=1 Tax=Phytohabitans rumicis TaxID=1076125 RepID=A0A6V8L7I4_9ACTN|nr:hypothetical protein [Phytohabitans rumicis]GFJ90086.1 hypothetical protein Prum_037280 [Phytohabitans rumicis]